MVTRAAAMDSQAKRVRDNFLELFELIIMILSDAVKLRFILFG
jgi:hypothetical protein